jgi:hypothetical protein
MELARALDAARRTGQEFLIARVLQERAYSRLARLTSDEAALYIELELARADLDEAIPIVTRIGDRFQLSHAIHDLAWLELVAGDYDRALEHLAEAWNIDTVNQDRVSIVDCSFNLGLGHLHRDEPDTARRWFLESLTLAGSVGDVAGEGFALLGLSSADPDPRRATRLLGASDALLSENDARFQMLEARLRTATVERLRAQLGAAAFETAYADGRQLLRRAALELARKA